ncbi:AraC family transcriptional regulator [Fictibacillus phosphorivorans]|uniref:AraC family transcriptional regulator n=1 Tax=Fictibacillus phosphorivorans TaxID=1221500 RepID=UPI00203FF6F9|nr:AraC family transcriptional regulator [Fictibacillus phosphorivorans]MCM3718070.1 AraC family transcriptional regulator [Fictibacillus phosphorivorans]MCM3775697.1 AraC family transcriptional regulator [Fictibacillus phosphorivorans]
MSSNHILHILNGQVMDKHFSETNYLEDERNIPFNEAMCVGKTLSDIFSKKFSEIRSMVHHVTVDEYTKITLQPLQPLLNHEFERVELWFDADMFCQINYLTILAWLDQANHQSTITLHIVDDHFQPIEHYTIRAQGYYELYKLVLMEKTMPDSINLAPLKKGVELYLDYLKEDNEIMRFIQENLHLSDDELTTKLFKNYKEYGLGDLQYLDMIKKSRLTQQK